MAPRPKPPNRTAVVGSYRANVDPVGVDASMAETLGLNDKPKARKKKTTLVDAVKKTFGIK
jgi:hypothetical protein